MTLLNSSTWFRDSVLLGGHQVLIFGVAGEPC